MLLRLVPSCVPHMGVPPSPWYEIYFESMGEVTCSAVVCAIWLMTSLH